MVESARVPPEESVDDAPDAATDVPEAEPLIPCDETIRTIPFFTGVLPFPTPGPSPIPPSSPKSVPLETTCEYDGEYGMRLRGVGGLASGACSWKRDGVTVDFPSLPTPDVGPVFVRGGWCEPRAGWWARSGGG
jgi:hypothetical protein